MNLSLCMIVKNEESFLPATLASVVPFVDDLVIVDTGSNDSTVEIAEKFGANVIKHQTQKLDEARNISIDNAKGEWILCLDADESITESGFRNIRNILTNDLNAYQLEVYNYFGEGEWSITHVIRLFPNCDSMELFMSPLLPLLKKTEIT